MFTQVDRDWELNSTWCWRYYGHTWHRDRINNKALDALRAFYLMDAPVVDTYIPQLLEDVGADLV